MRRRVERVQASHHARPPRNAFDNGNDDPDAGESRRAQKNKRKAATKLANELAAKKKDAKSAKAARKADEGNGKGAKDAKKAKIKDDICRNWNFGNKGNRDPCSFRHVCSACEGDHKSIDCKSV